MPKTQTSCPRCRQPVVAEIQQLFDVNIEPGAKQRFLSGSVNLIRCTSCGFQGNLPTPIVYHDPEKELLLTFFPPEMGLPVNEQEKLIGPLINQVVNKLPNEKRKAYLLQPKTMFTYQSLIEKVLEADGISKEMLDEQQKKLNLIQRLLGASPESRPEIIKQEESLIDESSFALIARLAEASSMQGDQATAKALAALQNDLIQHTEVGRILKVRSDEVQAAIKSLQEAGEKGLTREALLDLVINAPSETRLTTLAGLARNGMDYNFFQLLTERIDKATGEDQQKLLDLRQKLLDLTQAIDKKIEEEVRTARMLLEKILNSDDLENELEKAIPEINEYFSRALETALEDARQRGDLPKSDKLQKVISILEKASAPPPEIAFIEAMISTESDIALDELIQQNDSLITPQLGQLIANFLQQPQTQQDKEILSRLEKVYKAVTKYSMQKNIKI